MATSQQKLQLFDSLWSRSSQPVMEMMVPARSKIEIPLPGSGWFYVIEVARFQGKSRILLEPFWEQKEFLIELLVMTGDRCVIGIAGVSGEQSAQLIEQFVTERAKLPEPDRIFRWHVAGSTTSDE